MFITETVPNLLLRDFILYLDFISINITFSENVRKDYYKEHINAYFLIAWYLIQQEIKLIHRSDIKVINRFCWNRSQMPKIEIRAWSIFIPRDICATEKDIRARVEAEKTSILYWDVSRDG